MNVAVKLHASFHFGTSPGSACVCVWWILTTVHPFAFAAWLPYAVPNAAAAGEGKHVC